MRADDRADDLIEVVQALAALRDEVRLRPELQRLGGRRVQILCQRADRALERYGITKDPVLP